MADSHSSSNHVPVLFSFSVFSRPSSVALGSGYEVLLQKFVSVFGHQVDVHRKLVLQCFSEDWGQYIDLPKGFTVSERCRLRLVPLQMHVSSNLTQHHYSSVCSVFCGSVSQRFEELDTKHFCFSCNIIV